jgi:hypothetical protein
MRNRYRVNDAEIIHETIDGEVMLLNLTNGNYFSLDNVGVLIWEMITLSCPLEILSSAMIEFDPNSKMVMETSLQQVVSQMLEEGLMVPCEDHTPLNRKEIIRSLKSRLEDGAIRLEPPVLHMYKDIQEKYAHPAGVKAV